MKINRDRIILLIAGAAVGYLLFRYLPDAISATLDVLFF